jgi:DNA-binding NtrC family response regulator
MARIAIIDDEAAILQRMTQLCQAAGHEVFGCHTHMDGMAAIRAHQPELAIVDLHGGDVNGFGLVRVCRDQFPSTAIMMLMNPGSAETAIEAMRLGVVDHLTKPFGDNEFIQTVLHALRHQDSPAEAARQPQPSDVPRRLPPPLSPSSKLIGQSETIQRILDIVRRVANHDSPVLIEGEFGTGKRMAARALHEASHRRERPFEELTCATMSEDALEADFFGPNSIFQRVAGGTVHLTEVNQLPTRIQTQLYRFMHETQTRRSGFDGSDSTGDCRLIASTTASLEQAVKQGQFRENLFYKLCVVPLKIAPLRERREDIRPLLDHFLQEIGERTKTHTKTIDSQSIDFLETYRWPGNVSELRNAIEHACAFAESHCIRAADLPTKITEPVEVATKPTTEGVAPLPIGTKLDDFIKSQERLFIQETLKLNNGSREKTAYMLGVSIATLYRKMGLNTERKTQM